MRRNHRIDANQPEIAAALREAGYSVRDMSEAGDGFTDCNAIKGDIVI